MKGAVAPESGVGADRVAAQARAPRIMVLRHAEPRAGGKGTHIAMKDKGVVPKYGV